MGEIERNSIRVILIIIYKKFMHIFCDEMKNISYIILYNVRKLYILKIHFTL
jgi:hypothetical protein